MPDIDETVDEAAPVDADVPADVEIVEVQDDPFENVINFDDYTEGGDDGLGDDFMAQLFAAANGPPVDEAPINVTRTWLDESSFRAIATLQQGTSVALVVSDGENTILVYDSHQQPAEDLATLLEVVAQAADVVLGNTPDEEGTDDA